MAALQNLPAIALNHQLLINQLRAKYPVDHLSEWAQKIPVLSLFPLYHALINDQQAPQAGFYISKRKHSHNV